MQSAGAMPSCVLLNTLVLSSRDQQKMATEFYAPQSTPVKKLYSGPPLIRAAWYLLLSVSMKCP